jgi:hypothetical protein
VGSSGIAEKENDLGFGKENNFKITHPAEKLSQGFVRMLVPVADKGRVLLREPPKECQAN